MDSMDLSAATSAGDKKQRLRKKGRNRRRRLHLRKTAVQPPTMQSEDKCGPKKIAEEWVKSEVWPSSKKTSQEAQHSQQGTNDSDKTLRFTCSQCSDNLEYVPKDLVAHFEDTHRGSPPVFSCHTCTFKTHEFSYLQIHLLSHMDTFSCCSICNDDVQRTWPEFSAHLTLCHCQNGKYSCQICQRFSTGDVKVFLEHIYAHNLGLEGLSSDVSLRTKDKNQFGPKPSTLRCQHCGYEATQKWLITKHIKAVHVCQNGNLRQRKKEEVHSIAMKQKDPIPKIKPRLTRSAVKEMCWLTQDCLSLPGREFLDKYCHLSDPQTTLEETQQFLMKSVARETGDQKWTKALKSVLSNVPQDVTLHPKSENGIMSNSSDLTVLTVKNKITVAQNGAAYAKKMRRMTASDKETGFPESAADDARCAVDQNGCQSNLNDCPPCPQTESNLLNDISVSAKSEASGCMQMQENRENQKLETDPKMEEHGRKQQEPMHEDVINISSELKLTNESTEPTSIRQVLPKNKRRNRRRKRRSKKVYKKPSGLPLKIVLKKNPVKEKQWVSQSSLSPSGGDPMDDNHGLPTPHITTERTAQVLSEKKWTRASRTDQRALAETITSDPQSKPGEELSPGCAAQPIGSINMDVNEPGMLVSSLSIHQEMQDDPEKSLHFPETDGDVRSSAGKSEGVAEAEVEMCPKNSPLQTSGSSMDLHEPDEKTIAAADGETQSSCTKSSPVSQPAITPQGEVNLEVSSLARPSEQSNHSAEGGGDRQVPADSCPDLLCSTHLPVGKAIQPQPSPASGHRCQPARKNQQRTLKLVAINSSQLVKRPAGDQPVVVLNHPDADIPEVTRIMEVVNRNRGEVQKVVLSRRTLSALSAINREAPQTYEPPEVQSDSASLTHRRATEENSVQERFLLRLKLRRLSRKKYEVVDAFSPSRDVLTKFRCWFCGRAFTSQEVWIDHRQRHLIEWKRPNCENS